MLLNKKKYIFFSVSLLFIGITMTVSSCQEDPADHSDLFLGKYSGRISYTNNGEGNTQSIAEDNGSVSIEKQIGASYIISFSNNIPTISGLQFKRTGDYDYYASGLPSNSYIKVKNKKLDISYIKGNLEEVWKADCIRSTPSPIQ